MTAMPPQTLLGNLQPTENDFEKDQQPKLAVPTTDLSMPCVKNIKVLEQEIRERVSGKFNTGAFKGNEFAEIVERIVH